MELIMNGLLIAGTLFAGTYCWVLSRRVRALMDLDKGLGGAITTMTRQIEQARKALEEAKSTGQSDKQELRQLAERAEASANQLRMLMAAMKEPERPLFASRAAEQPARRERPARPRAEALFDDGVELRAEPREEREREPEAAPVRRPAAASRPRQAAPEEDLPPKPRAVTFDGLLRRPLPPRPRGIKRSEDEIMAALSEMASGSGRT